jgi:hypothetical protein
LAGCSRPVPVSKHTVAKKDDVELARELYQNASEPAQFRDANDRANNYLASNPDALTRHFPGTKDKTAILAILQGKPNLGADKLDDKTLYEKFLESTVGLDKAEIDEVEHPSFTLLDAHYLEGCNLIREIERSLMLQGLPPLEQAQRCFDWTMRHVLLQEGRTDLLPPQYILKRGQGSAEERALVFMSLLQQAPAATPGAGPRLQGSCLLAIPGKQGAYQAWMVGVLVATKDKKDLYLFDPRTGLAIPGPHGKGIATLEQARSDKSVQDVLQDIGAIGQMKINTQDGAAPRMLLPCALSSLSARMRYLEDELLAGHDRIRLVTPPADLMEAFGKLNAGPVLIWNAPTSKAGTPPSPTRALRAFLPKEEGGLDKNKQRIEMFLVQLVPAAAINKGFADQGLGNAEFPIAEAQDILRSLSRSVWWEFNFIPSQDLMHGRLEACKKRLVRIQKVLDEVIAKGPDSAGVAAWKKRLLSAYQDRSRDPAQVVQIWNEDRWLGEFLNNPDEDLPNPKLASKKTVSDVVLRAVSEPMKPKSDYLLALRWQEKAERLHVSLPLEERLQVWSNAEYWWAIFSSNNPLSVDSLQKRLDVVKDHVKSNRTYLAAGLLEYYGKAFREEAMAGLLQARALLQCGKKDAAKDLLKKIVANLSELEQEAGRQRQQWQQTLKEVAAPQDRDPLRAALDGLLADFGPDGSMVWQRANASLQAAGRTP